MGTMTYPPLRHTFRILGTLSVNAMLLVHFGLMCEAQEKPQTAKPLPAILSFEAKDLPLAQALRQLAEKSKFNFVMAEAPEPGDSTDVTLKNLTFAQAMEKLCKPFDYTYKRGPGNILLYECRYTNLSPMPPLTMGEVWAYIEDLEQLAKPYRGAKGDGVSHLCRQLVRSLTPLQWQELGKRAKTRTGLTYAELSPAQQRLLVDYTTSQEFDFFAVDTQQQPWFQVLQHEDSAIMTLYEPGSVSRTRPDHRFRKYIFIASYLQDQKEYGELCVPPFVEEAHITGSSYRRSHSRPIETILPQALVRELPEDAKRVHLYAINAPLYSVAAKIEEQTGQKLAIDKAIRNVRLSLWLDDVSFADSIQAIANLHDWYFSLRDDGISLLLRRRNESPPRFSELPDRIVKALPVAVRRYMRLDSIPQDVSEEQKQTPGFFRGYNWKIKEAINEAKQRVADWDFTPFRKNRQTLKWKDLHRWQQNDFLTYILYDLLNYARPLHRGYPAYVAFPEACILRMSDVRKSPFVSLEICATGPDGKYSALGAGGEDNLDAETVAALRKQGIFPKRRE